MKTTFGLLTLTLLICTGCSGTIHPPVNPPSPVTVYVADYGRHSSVLLPGKDNGYVEWGFGDWNWFALGHTTSDNAMKALFASPQATLGCREVPHQTDDAALTKALDTVRLVRFEVSSQSAKALQEELEQRYAKHADTQVYSSYSKLWQVKDDEHYSWANNCNHLTLRWLRELGCRVDGTGFLSDFKLAS